MQKSLRVLIPAVTWLASAAAAQAQTTLQNGVTVFGTTTTTDLSRTDPVNRLDLSVYGSSSTPTEFSFANLVSRTPTIQMFGGTSVSLSFTGFSGIFNNYARLPQVNQGDSLNYLLAMDGSVSMDFS